MQAAISFANLGQPMVLVMSYLHLSGKQAGHQFVPVIKVGKEIRKFPSSSIHTVK